MIDVTKIPAKNLSKEQFDKAYGIMADRFREQKRGVYSKAAIVEFLIRIGDITLAQGMKLLKGYTTIIKPIKNEQ